MRNTGIFTRCLILLLCGSVHGLAYAQSAAGNMIDGYPDRPIRLVVPVAPGGSSDGVARVIAQKLTEQWKQQVVVDNRAGAAAIIGTNIVAKADPDGYTLVLVSLRHSVNPSLLKLPFDSVRDFAPVTMTAAVGNVLVVNPKSPITSVKDLIALAKQKPGELNFASSGIGGAPHLTGEFFALKTGIKLTHIAYKGGGPAVADVVGGNVTMSFASMTSALPFIRSSRLRPLAVSSKTRSLQLPEVPTMAEAGVADVFVLDWQGVLSPRGTPKPIVDKLSGAIRGVLKDPDSVKRLSAMGLDVIASTPDEFGKAIAADVKRWAEVVKTANIKAE
ncbi:MAG: tripartite tricarboxylate transporter substrate binding protein [Betaproteobacteria bacterium]|jgi:tripartite-type tricarboxylate transporter receptor subunit TctC|nr:tripartite tricarboxylate transporter substrate binding protein [Betaproteobacteria bacterium]